MSGKTDRTSTQQPPPGSAEADRHAWWQRVERLSRAAIRITEQRDLSRVLQEIVDSARDTIGARYAALGILAPGGNELATFVVSGIAPDVHAKIGDLPRGHGILGLLIEDPRPLRLKDLSKHPRSYGFPPHHPPMTSFLGVPVTGRNGPIGNLYITEKHGADEFTAEDEAFAVLLASHAAVAVENARYNEEREQLVTELRNLQVSRDRFFSMINHELRNALTAVYGWAELWIRKAGDDVPRAATEVYESAERTLVLLDDLLDLSRLEADRLRPMIRECDVWRVVRESASSVEPAAQRRSIDLRLSGPDGDVPCRSDPQRIRQILINLLTNAVRHSPEGTVVVVEVQATERTIRLKVADEGEGIAPEQQAVIFEAFERAGSETERGTGLGLALSRKLARMLGGDLVVESQAGAGARFTLVLPRFAAAS